MAVRGDVSRPAIEVTCRSCGASWPTRTRANTVTCHCGARQYVPASAHGGPPPRPRVPCACSGCGHEWTSRAAHHATVRCPSCGQGHSVQRPADRPAKRERRSAPSRGSAPTRTRQPSPREPAETVRESSPARPRRKPAERKPTPTPTRKPARPVGRQPRRTAPVAPSARPPAPRTAAPVVEGVPVDPMTLGSQWAPIPANVPGVRVFVSDRTLSAPEVVPVSSPAGLRLPRCSACRQRAAYVVRQDGRERAGCTGHARAAAVLGAHVRALLYLPA